MYGLPSVYLYLSFLGLRDLSRRVVLVLKAYMHRAGPDDSGMLSLRECDFRSEVIPVESLQYCRTTMTYYHYSESGTAY